MHDDPTATVPDIRRVRHELRKRDLRVLRSERLTPNMQRLVLGGEELADFRSDSPDDHLKVFLPQPGGEAQMRDYTPRRYDRQANELVLDFVVHEGGPAATWAIRARPGDTISIGGPRGSRVIGGDITQWLFIDDESALPAIGRFVEELPAGVRATVVASVPTAADAQDLPSQATLELHWIARDGIDAADPAPLLRALAMLPVAPDCFVWAAAEAQVARAVRRYLLDQRGHSPKWMKVAGYWIAGEANASIKDLDETP